MSKKKIELLSLAVFLSALSFFFIRVSGCGSIQKPQDPSPVTSSTPATCGNLSVGQTTTTLCPDGKSLQVQACTDQGLKTAISCPAVSSPCGKVTFADIKPIIQAKCLSCHQIFDQYPVAQSEAAKMATRVNLDPSNPLVMPKGAAPLPADQRALFSKWPQDGLLEACPQASNVTANPYLALADIEQAMEDDLNTLNQNDRLNTRYLILSHKIDQGVSATDMGVYSSAVNKGVNSLNAIGTGLVKLTQIGPQNSIVRLNLQDLNLSIQDWNNIANTDPFKIESFTNTGVQIKILTNNRRPWMHADNFLDTTFRQPSLYYNLLRIPTSLLQLQRNLGINFQQDINNFRVDFLGEATSVISLGKNRLIVRDPQDATAGYFWQTFDTLALNGIPQRNLFQFPLLLQTGGRAIFDFDASEVIYSLPNGLQAYALFDAKGNRLNLADPNVVEDNTGANPKGAVIVNAASCTRCHQAGLIPMVDGVLNSVTQNASQFVARDVQLVQAFYQPAATNAALFTKDNQKFQTALSGLGVALGTDPQVALTDKLLNNWDVNQAAAFLFLKPADFVNLLNQSAQGRVQLGPLLSGGTVTYDQFVQTFQTLVNDLQLFQQPLGK